jgi:ankyrin repeat protein
MEYLLRDDPSADLAKHIDDLREVRRMLAAGADINRVTEINYEKKWNCTALFACVQANELVVMAFLLENGADVEKSAQGGSIDGWTPLRAAIEKNFVHAARLLLEYGANVSHKNKPGESAFDFVKEDNNAMIQLLLNSGLEVDESACQESNTLYNAVKHRRINLVRCLLQRGVNASKQLTNKSTALHRACWNRSWPIARLLIDYSANGTILNSLGQTPFHHASQRSSHLQQDDDQYYVIFSLLKQSISVDLQDSEGYTPLHFACQGQAWTLACLLLKHSADMSIKTINGETAFHLACEVVLSSKRRDYVPDVLQQLYFHDVDINRPVKRGWTLLHCAADNACKDLVQFLLANGACLHIKNSFGNTPLSLCFPLLDRQGFKHLPEYFLQSEKIAFLDVANLLLHYGACNDTLHLADKIWSQDRRDHFEQYLHFYALNWYFVQFSSCIAFESSELVCYAVAYWNQVLLQNPIRNSDLLAAVLGIIYDHCHHNQLFNN